METALPNLGPLGIIAAIIAFFVYVRWGGLRLIGIG